ncbi:hypothetical protein KY332_00225 [Candidatus Woesearchaeota archaeon]|nr:hypothetical protein [Candidatus Woesearchaeota archaeon]
MKRKVIKQGNGTLTITLPKQWTKNFNVRGGEEINVQEAGPNLLIQSRTTATAGKINIKLTTADKFLIRFLENPYRLGYNEMYISFEDPKIIKKVQNALPNMMGFEMIEQGSRHCVIKQLMTEEEKEFKTTFNRLFHLVGSLGKDTYQALKENSKEKMQEVISTELLTNKFSNFCERILNRRAYQNPAETNLFYYITAGLEQIADSYKNICKAHIHPSKQALSLLNETNNIFEDFKKLFSKFNKESQFKLRQNKQNLYNKIKAQKKDAVLLEHLVMILNIIEHMSMRTHEEYQPLISA